MPGSTDRQRGTDNRVSPGRQVSTGRIRRHGCHRRPHRIFSQGRVSNMGKAAPSVRGQGAEVICRRKGHPPRCREIRCPRQIPSETAGRRERRLQCKERRAAHKERKGLQTPRGKKALPQSAPLSKRKAQPQGAESKSKTKAPANGSFPREVPYTQLRAGLTRQAAIIHPPEAVRRKAQSGRRKKLKKRRMRAPPSFSA